MHYTIGIGIKNYIRKNTSYTDELYVTFLLPNLLADKKTGI